MNTLTESEIIFKITGKNINSDSLKITFENSYNKDAIDFLLETETECNIHFMSKQFPSWGKEEVNTYSVTLKNKRSSYTFTFYDSIKNTQDRKSATFQFYSVLACLDSNYAESFDDFISDFGYEIKTERDYVRIKKIHLDCIDESKALRKLFTEEQLEKLNDIR